MNVTQIHASAVALPCSRSPVAGFAKKVTLKPGLVFHWKVLYGNTLRAAIIAQASSGAQKGWIAIGWTKSAGKMYPADAVVGNLGTAPAKVEPTARMFSPGSSSLKSHRSDPHISFPPAPQVHSQRDIGTVADQLQGQQQHGLGLLR
ncbi:unnamed protein product [Closterium sp. Naga37s-1]|nr:unnamed protein product [Closterium sp. Naga37s-1]